MQDFDFGNRLFQLRKKAGLSQSGLGSKIGVSNKAVSKWETGRAKPGLDIVHKLADTLNVSVDDLLNLSSSEKQITKIVITGGPCAGKTTAMSWIQNAFTKLGYAVLFVDEYFHVVSMQPSSPIGIPEWDEIYRTKAMNRDQVFRTLDEFLSGREAFYQPFYADTGSCAAVPKIFAEVVQDNK